MNTDTYIVDTAKPPIATAQRDPNALGFDDGLKGRQPRSINEIGGAAWTAYAYGHAAGAMTRNRKRGVNS